MRTIDPDSLFAINTHLKAADKRANELFAYCQAVWPMEWYSEAQESITSSLFEFSWHAYRASELAKILSVRLDLEPIARSFLDVDQNNAWPWIFDYHYALNRIRHCNSFKFGNAKPSRKLFKNNENVQPAFVVVTTDMYPKAVAIPILPLAFNFLHEIKGKVIANLRR